MKIFNFDKSSSSKDLTSVCETYKVTWTRVTSEYSIPRVNSSCRFFSNKEDANEFAEQLKMAHEFLGNSTSLITRVDLELEDYGGLK